MRPRSVATLVASAAFVLGCADTQNPFETLGPDETATIVGLRLDRQVLNVRVGDTVRLRARYIDAKGRILDATTVQWRSSDAQVTGVEQDGLVVTLAEGDTEVTAVGANNVQATASVKTTGNNNNAVTGIRISPNPASTTVGDAAQLTAIVSYANGSEVQVRGSAKWTIANTGVATVNGNGVVTGVAEGSTQITASIRNVSDEGDLSVGAAVAPPTAAPGETGEVAPPPPLSGSGAPEAPRAYVDVSMPSVSRTIRVAAGQNLQQAIDAAQPGDELVLDAGATYTGHFTLKKKSGTGWITIRSSGTLPAPGTRVRPTHASQMAKLVGTTVDPVIRTEAGAARYRLIGLEVTAPTSLTMTYSLIFIGDVGSAQNTLDQQPSHIVLDRMYVHGHSNLSFQRCIALNSAYSAVVDSWVSQCHAKGFDSQAIVGWNGAGPFKIVNNYLEAAGENVMFGGADPSITNLTPSDIEVRRNHLFKPLSWKGVWTVKNLFELKHAQRVLVEGNVMENNWSDAQSGFAVLLQALSDDNTAPWAKVHDVSFRYNIVRNSPQMVVVLSRVAYGGVMPNTPSSRITFEQNLFEQVGGGQIFQLLDDLVDMRVLNNTVTGKGNVGLMMEGRPMTRLVFTGNVFESNYGALGSGYGEGTNALNHFAPGHVFTSNALVARQCSLYPAGNTCPTSVSGVPSGLGADRNAVLAATSGVVIQP